MPAIDSAVSGMRMMLLFGLKCVIYDFYSPTSPKALSGCSRAFHCWCRVAELAALDGISKAVAACNSEYASSEGQGDAAAYQTR